MGVVLAIEKRLCHELAGSSRILNLARQLTEHGIRVAVFGLTPPKSLKTGFPLVSFPEKEGNKALGFLSRNVLLPLGVIGKLIDPGFDTVLVRGCALGFVLLPFARIMGKRFLFDFHGFVYKEQLFYGRSLKAKVTRFKERFCLRHADKILVVSHGMRADMLGEMPEHVGEKTIILPNGVDASLFAGPVGEAAVSELRSTYGIPNDRKVVGFVGANNMMMELGDILGLPRHLRDDEVVVMVEKTGSVASHDSDKLIVLDWIPHEHVVVLLKAVFDVCVVPYNKSFHGSNIPGFLASRKVGEYVAAGKPVVISDVIGGRNDLKEGVNCLLYRSGDPGDLAEKIHKLLDDKALYEKMAKNNKELAGSFNWSNCLEGSGLLGILRNP